MNSLTLIHVHRVRGLAMLTLSNGEVLSMPRAMLKERPYRAGTPFDRDAFDSLMRERAYSFAMEKAVSLLAMRPRTEKELREALARNAYPEHVIERVLSRMHEAGYINDSAFAEQWTASRIGKGMGTQRIRMELRRKGIDSSEIDLALASIDEDDRFAGALKAARKAASGKNLAEIKDRQKILAALARRGYDYATAKEALTFLLNDDT